MTGPGAIEVALRENFGRFTLDAAFTVPASGVTAIFGPSGCGKTSILRCIAGLHRAAEGRCVIQGEVWQDANTFRPAHRRPVGYVFQEASLFAHLSVRRNLLFGAPRAAGPRDTPWRIGLDEVVALLGLAGLLDRAPANLSGGERQRVAIGRALLSQPSLLLMDEPLSALDRDAREEILPFIERLHATLALPVIYVSHDMTEIERLADHLVLLSAGRVVAAGSLSALQSDPALPLFRARDAAVSLDAVVQDHDPRDGLATLAVPGGSFLVPSAPLPIGQRRRLRILAGDVSLARTPQQSTIVNMLPARILSASIGGHAVIAVLGLGADGQGARLLARITLRSWRLLALAEGMQVVAQVKGVALAPAKTGVDS